MFTPRMTSTRQHDSFASRVSGLFTRRVAPSEVSEGDRQTTTYEVPLFLSPNRYEPRQENENVIPPSSARRSRTSTRSVIDATISGVARVQPLSLPASSRYSSPATSPVVDEAPKPAFNEDLDTSTGYDLESQTSKTTTQVKKTTRHKRKRRVSSKHQVQSLKQLTIAFGITLVLASLTYLVLAVTGTAGGVMFHVLVLLFLLGLTGVFLYCLVRFLSLASKRRERRIRQQEKKLVVQPYALHKIKEWETDQSGSCDHAHLERTLQLMTGEDGNLAVDDRRLQVDVQMPPPIYGNFRESKRVNPNLVHVYTVPPSPLTPTYAEAMNSVQRSVGYRPPSYADSESGATQIVQVQRRDVDHALYQMHHPTGYGRGSAVSGQPF